MIQLIDATPTQIKELCSPPAILELISGQKNFNLNDWSPDPHSLYIAGEYEGDLIGLITLRPVTNRMLEIHIHIMPEHQRSGLGLKFSNLTEKYVIDNTPFRILQCFIPECRKDVQAFAKAYGFTYKCTYENAVEFLGEEMALQYYIKVLDEEN